MRNDILFGILLTLLQEGKKSYAYLADKFEVSKRTIQRYCLTLEMAGIPTTCSFGRNGGIEILGSFNLDSMFFTKQELKRLQTHLHASPLSKLDNVDKQIEEKLEFQAESKIPDTTSNFIVDYNSWDEELKLNPLIKVLNSEIDQQKTYKITYLNSNGILSSRVISPYKFILKNSKWYLFAYCHQKQQTRVFKLNRIQDLSPSTETFVKNKLSDAQIKERLNHLFEQIEITIQASPTILPDTLEWLNDYKITYTKNGNALITGTATKSYELFAKLLTNSQKLKVIKPQSLIDELLKTADNLKTIYKKK